MGKSQAGEEMDGLMTNPANIRYVDLSRLASGHWDHKTQKEVGRGDINASYSGDTIAMNQPVRKPFQYRGEWFVQTGNTSTEYEAYRLVAIDAFDDEPTTYYKKLYGPDMDNGEVARNDPMGFYHGMTVKHGKGFFVLVGPEITFTARKE